MSDYTTTETTPVPLAKFIAYNTQDIELYSHASGYALALWDLQQELRGYIKHGHTFKDADEALDKVYGLIFELRNQYHLPQD